MFERFEELPPFIQSYVTEMVAAAGPTWVCEPVPALQNKSFLQFCNEKGILAAADYLTNVGTKLGIPYGVKVPDDYR